jgi:hypothetical protein
VSEDDEDEVDHLKALDLGQAGPSPLKKLCQAIIEHRYFGPFFVVCIAVNTLVLAMEYDGMPRLLRQRPRRDQPDSHDHVHPGDGQQGDRHGVRRVQQGPVQHVRRHGGDFVHRRTGALGGWRL